MDRILNSEISKISKNNKILQENISIFTESLKIPLIGLKENQMSQNFMYKCIKTIIKEMVESLEDYIKRLNIIDESPLNKCRYEDFKEIIMLELSIIHQEFAMLIKNEERFKVLLFDFEFHSWFDDYINKIK